MLIVSDLHFGELQPELVEQFVLAAAEDGDKVVVISGDITQQSRPQEIAAAAAFIRQLLALNIVVCTTISHAYGESVATAHVFVTTQRKSSPSFMKIVAVLML